MLCQVALFRECFPTLCAAIWLYICLLNRKLKRCPSTLSVWLVLCMEFFTLLAAAWLCSSRAIYVKNFSECLLSWNGTTTTCTECYIVYSCCTIITFTCRRIRRNPRTPSSPLKQNLRGSLLYLQCISETLLYSNSALLRGIASYPGPRCARNNSLEIADRARQ